MTCSLQPAGILLEVPLGPESAGNSIRIGIRAGDILLALRQPEGLSARNLLSGHVRSLRQRDVTCVAEIDCGVSFEAHLTLAAQRSLQLAPGKPVWMVIKTYSCHPLRPE